LEFGSAERSKHDADPKLVWRGDEPRAVHAASVVTRAVANRQRIVPMMMDELSSEGGQPWRSAHSGKHLHSVTEAFAPALEF
jgi:hypothetical protein